MRVLVVDDEPVSRKLLKGLLSDFFECEAVESGGEAIAAFKRAWENWAPFDIITLDISMPDMDGKEVLKTIRAIENGKNVPKGKQVKILMASGNVDKNTIITCVQMGCDDYIAGGGNVFCDRFITTIFGELYN